VDINAPVEDNLKAIAKGLNRDVEDLVIVVLDRERHRELIDKIRKAGARIKLISDGDLSAGIAAALEGTGIHALMGVGGAPEGVLAAAAVKCINGGIQTKLFPFKTGDADRVKKMGLSGGFKKVYHTEDLAPGKNIVFTASGVTPGDLLKGVRFFGGGYRVNSIVMTCTPTLKTVKFIENVTVDAPGKISISLN
ncbi:MAG: fructose-bisphosphatase class II, partial [Elusimicrobiota bacterium]